MTSSLTRLLAFLLLALAIGTVAGVSASPAPAGSTPCWKRLLDDWVVNGRIDKAYPASCYRETIAHLPEDVKRYSSAREDIEQALLDAIRANNGRAPKIIQPPRNQPEDVIPGIDGSGDGGDASAGSGGSGSDGDDGFLGGILRADSADSVPVPLLVLAGLALLLLGAAGVAYATRRVQARRVRVTPFPHDAPRR